MLLLKRVAKTIAGLSVCILFFTNPIKATHVVGGQIEVKWITGNDFEITLTVYRNCLPGAVALQLPIKMCIFKNVTDELYLTYNASKEIVTPLVLGDACYTPTGICIESHVLKDTIQIDDYSNGYYMSCEIVARNGGIANILAPSNTYGMTFYAEIPDPALHDSSPVFKKYPKAYLCAGFDNLEDISATDADGDTLKYYLEIPLKHSCPYDNSSGTYTPCCNPRPYPPVLPKTAAYTFPNVLGATPAHISMDINTGIMTANPNLVGVYVIAVRVEEWRGGVKIGEIRRDMQYTVKPDCQPNIPPKFIPQTFNDTPYVVDTIVTNDSICFSISANDLSQNETLKISLSGDVVNTDPDAAPVAYITNPIYSYSVATPDTVGYTICIQTNCANVRSQPYHLKVTAQDTSTCYQYSNKIFYDMDIYVTTPNLTALLPNVFTPNGDNKNDYFATSVSNYPERNYCFDKFNIKIYSRWGNLVYESEDILFKWDGKKKGKDLDDGVYYYIISSKFHDIAKEEKGFVHLVR